MTIRSLAVFSKGEIMGDALYKIPFARAVRAAYPEARIVWLTTFGTTLAGKLRPMLDGVVDEVLADSGIGGKPAQLLVPPPLPEPFDLVIDTQSILWRSLVLRRACRGLFISPSAGFLLSHRRPPRPYRRPVHIVDRLMDLLELACGRRPPPSGKVRIPPEMAAKAARLLPQGPIYIGFAPGSGGANKCWPLERYIAAARAQEAAGRVPVFILGPQETDWLEAIRPAVPSALFPEQEEAVWGAGFSPLRTVALAERFAAGVANDSGVSHMFAAADAPLLTLHGPSDGRKFHPVVSHGLYLRAQDFGGAEIDRIPLAAVLDHIERLLKDRNDEQRAD